MASKMATLYSNIRTFASFCQILYYNTCCRCFKSQQIHLERFQSIQSSFNAPKVNINAIMSKIATAVKPKIKNAYILANLNNYCTYNVL